MEEIFLHLLLIFLSKGGSFNTLGPAVDTLYALPPFKGVLGLDGGVTGFVIHVDRFGNLVTNIHSSQISGDVCVEVLDHLIAKQVRAFYEGKLGEPILYVHSSGYLGITMNKSNASDVLGIGQGEKVSILARGS